MRKLQKGLLLFGVWFIWSVPVAWAQAGQADCRPGITFASLIGSIAVGFRDGRLSIDKLYAVCLPLPSGNSASTFPYDPDDGAKLSMILKNSEGKVLNTYMWRAERIGNLWEMSQYKVIGGAEAIAPLGSGNFLLEFAAEAKTFQRFQFSIALLKSSDPYQPPGDCYFIEGPWNDYANLYFQRNDPKSSLSFSTWVRDKVGKDGKRSVPYTITLLRSSDHEVLAGDTGTLRLEPRWLKAELLLRPAAGDKNSYYHAGELLQRDGTYSFRFTVDGMLFGEYPFEVREGRIQLQGRQVRESTDPMLFIVDYMYGGKYTSWWIRRVGS